MTRRVRRSLAALATTAFLGMGVVMAPSASAASLGWLGTSSGSWATAANWSPAQTPVNDDVLSFPASAANQVMQNDLAPSTRLALNFSGANYTVNGTNPIDLQAITQTVAGTNQINTPITSTAANIPIGIAAGGTVALNSLVAGSTGIAKTGLGKLILAGTNPYTGTTLVGAGSVIVNGSINASQTQVVGGTLGGGGSTGAVVATSGSIAPGDGGSAILAVNGPLTLNTGVIASFDINGTTVGTQFDQIAVSGTVTLTGATLAITGSTSGAINSTYVIINNTGAGAIVGTFNGLAEGATVTGANGATFRINYGGGTGNNDVVLTQLSAGGKAQVLSGVDRVDTAVKISQNSFPAAGSANAVVLARGDIFPDALAGAPLAVNKVGPLLLANLAGPPTTLDPRTVVEIQRVLTPGKTIFVLGGTAAIPDAMVQQLQGLGYQVPRQFAGTDRFQTAVLIAQVGLNNPANLFLASGANFPDALSVGPAAAKAQGAILLTNNNLMPTFTQDYLTTRAGATVYAIGGPAAQAGGAPAANQIVGVDRYDTAVKTAQRFFTNPTAVGIASGVAFPDGLTGGAHIGKLGGPLLLTDPNALPGFTQTYLQSIKTTLTQLFVYGGPLAVATPVVVQINVIVA